MLFRNGGQFYGDRRTFNRSELRRRAAYRELNGDGLIVRDSTNESYTVPADAALIRSFTDTGIRRTDTVAERCLALS